MKNGVKILSGTVIALVLSGCFGPVLHIGDKIVPLKNHNGIPFISARSSFFKEIHYSTFGFDWKEKDGFLIPRDQNNVNYAFWISKHFQSQKLYTIVFTAEKQRHYIKKTEIPVLMKYLAHAYRFVPGSKIKLSTLKIEPGSFKGLPAVYVYMETFESGRNLHLREESWYFFDPLQPDTHLYQVRWSERGRESEWRSTEAETQGRQFFKCFKLLSSPEKR